MKKLFITLISGLSLGVALPARAGPDWQIIEQARKHKRAQWAALARDAAPATAETIGCPPPPLVLPLDHGPRAQSTPYLNQRRKERHIAEVRACKEAATKGRTK